jgi:gas vesicle protein
MSAEAIVVNEETIKQEALTVVEKAKIVKVIDQESYDSACELLLGQIKPFRKRWADYWDEVKKPAYSAYKAILDKFNEGDKPLAQAEAEVKFALSAWTAEQERKRQELQRQAEAEARKAEEEARAIEAAVAEDSGASPEEVEAIVEAPVFVVAKPVEATYVKANGLSMRDNWSARVVDIKKLCAAVAKGTVPVSYIEPNMTALNSRAKADRNTMNVPGVVAVNTPMMAGRTR